METTEGEHIPRGEGGSEAADMELADASMDDEFVTARPTPVADASISETHLPSY